jgi:cold shock CspA family protein
MKDIQFGKPDGRQVTVPPTYACQSGEYAIYSDTGDHPLRTIHYKQSHAVIIKWFNPQKDSKGCGSIASDRGGKEIFVCSAALRRAEIATLSVGQRVIFDIADSRAGPKSKENPVLGL